MERIGRYVVDRLLARGGMAEVFVARAEGPAGFSKSVVIKRILPELVQDENFVQMFLNEARLAAQLNHPNIVQVFDFGEHQGQYYLAMEYIEGESLRSILRAHQARKERLEPRLAAKLISGVCEGLHYAHQLCDENGASFNIVHRDVSPENILVSTSGIPKVLDFGIAKAASTTTRTEAGTVKGKYAYMCPEQIRGEGVDRQLDVYALGVTLYEMLVGRRPFVGESELALLNLILKGQASPVDVENPKVHPDLAAIVATAMANDKDERYPDCRSLQAALEDFLGTTGQRTGWVELGKLVEEAARHRKGKERADVPSSGPKGIPGFPVAGVSTSPQAVPPPPEVAPSPANEQVPTRTVGAPEDLAAALGALSAAPTTTQPRPQPEPPAATASTPAHAADDARQDTGVAKLVAREQGRRLVTVGVAVALATMLIVGLGLALSGGGSKPDAGAKPAKLDAPQKPSPLEPIAEPPKPPAVAAQPSATAAVAALDPGGPAEPGAVAAPVLLPEPGPGKSPDKPRVAPAGVPGPATGGSGFLTVRSDPWCDVYLDGQRLGTTPLNREAVPAGRHQLELRNDQVGARRRTTVVVGADKETRESVVFGQGTLYVEAPPQTEVFVNGRAVGKAPLDPLTLVEGSYQVKLVNRALGKEVTQSAKVKPGARQLVQVDWR